MSKDLMPDREELIEIQTWGEVVKEEEMGMEIAERQRGTER